MLNRANFEGRLTKDPELKKADTDNEKSYVKITIAVDRGFGGSNADFIPVIVWNKQAENLVKYKRKGDMISVDGSIRSGSYEDSNGNIRYTFEVSAKQIHFLSNAKRNTKNTESKTTQNDSSISENQINYDKDFNSEISDINNLNSDLNFNDDIMNYNSSNLKCNW